MAAIVQQAQRFSVHILGEQQMYIAKERDCSRVQFERIRVEGNEFLRMKEDECLGSMFCLVDSVVRVGDHFVVFGKVEKVSESVDVQGQLPLVYFNRKFSVPKSIQ
jgi:flavin reductase (DIM6/NTAB) family NADH-FMN oxidoreductase RutF